jgi:hypothetical protein
MAAEVKWAWARDFCSPGEATEAVALPLLYRRPINYKREQTDEITAIDDVQKAAGANNQTACDHL